MTPASELIKRCGGAKVVATWLGLERSAVQRWAYTGAKGTDERVPMRHWMNLIAEAARSGITITIDELMPPEVLRAARAGMFERQDAAA